MASKSSTPLARPICAGCSLVFDAESTAEIWCPQCRPGVEHLTVELSADQRRRVESLATIRGVTHAEILRLGIDSLAGRVKQHRLTGTEQQLAENLRPSRKLRH